MRREYKQRSERLSLTTAVEKVIPTRDIPRGQSPMELLTPREMSQTTETRLPTTGRVTIPDPSDTLGDPVVEQTVRKLIETAGRLVANRNAPGSGVTAPYGTIDDMGRVQLSQDAMTREGVGNATSSTRSSRVPDRKIREMPAKKVSRVIDVQKSNQLKYSFTGVPDTDPRACFNQSTWSPAVNMQQPPLVGTNNISISSDEEEALWESMMVCLFTTLWQRFNCAVLTVCTVPMSTKMLTATGRRHNEGAIRWNIILRNNILILRVGMLDG